MKLSIAGTANIHVIIQIFALTPHINVQEMAVIITAVGSALMAKGGK